jgi:F-type H+-transporting ATPase subunit gamma
MIQTLRQIKRRIRSIENTKKLTHAMEIISVSKLRPLQNRLILAKEFFLKTDGILGNVLSSFEKISHPLLEERERKQKVSLCLLTSDTGLCGSYNHDILHEAQEWIRQHTGREVNLVVVGKKGFTHFKRLEQSISDVYTELHGRYTPRVCDQITHNLIDLFLSGKADEVWVGYTHFDSAARRWPVMEKFLAINRGVPQASGYPYLAEPDIEGFLMDFIPLYLSAKMRFIMLNALVAEHSARGLAMKEATDNATEMLEGLVLMRNKVRQASITKEIIEVISSADALKG